MAKNEFTKTFCEQPEYQLHKKVHEQTVDRNYTAGKAEAIENMKEHDNIFNAYVYIIYFTIIYLHAHKSGSPTQKLFA